MATRTWVESDPEPADVSAVVDPEGITWTLDRDGEDYVEGWHQQLLVRYEVPDDAPPEARSVITGGSCFNDWADIFAHLPEGSALREATAEEAQSITLRMSPPRGATA